MGRTNISPPKNRLDSDRPLKNLKIRANIRPVLVRQGEPGTPQYLSSSQDPKPYIS